MTYLPERLSIISDLKSFPRSSATRKPDQIKYLKLLPYEEIKKRITKAVGEGQVLGSEIIPVQKANGRISAEQVVSKINLPRQNQAAMDGYAVRADETVDASISNPLSLKVVGSAYPGSILRSRLKLGSAYYTATGAPVPVGADAVVRVEETKRTNGEVRIVRPIRKWKNVFLRGEDYSKGHVLVEKGRVLNSSDVALLVSTGKKKIRVVKSPKVGILSIGDELTSLDRNDKDGKIVNNYYHLLACYLSEIGAITRSIGICRDNMTEIAENIKNALHDFDLLLTIGGSSVGTKDMTTDALLGLKKSIQIFHGVRIVPIRPAGLLMVGGKPIVVIPANVITVALSCFLIVRPVLNIMSGLKFEDRSLRVRAVNLKEFSNHRPITALFLGTLDKKDGTFYLTALEFSSNLILNLSRANAFVELGPNQSVSKGEEVVAMLLGATEIARISGN